MRYSEAQVVPLRSASLPPRRGPPGPEDPSQTDARAGFMRRPGPPPPRPAPRRGAADPFGLSRSCGKHFAESIASSKNQVGSDRSPWRRQEEERGGRADERPDGARCPAAAARDISLQNSRPLPPLLVLTETELAHGQSAEATAPRSRSRMPRSVSNRPPS
jgi:hypothetical protein